MHGVNPASLSFPVSSLASNPSRIILVRTILKVTSFITGEMFSVKSSPGIWLNSLATSLAL